MFVKQWEEKTTVSQISFQCTSFEITKKFICLLKIADTSFKSKLKFHGLVIIWLFSNTNPTNPPLQYFFYHLTNITNTH